MANPIICYTSIWLYLGRIDQVELLAKLYSPIFTTRSVCQELDIGRLSRPGTVDPSELSWVRTVQPSSADLANLPANRLGIGEQSVLAYAQAHSISIVGLDDRQARELALGLGLRIVGTVGLLLKAKEQSLIGEIRPLLTQLQQEGFYISQNLLNYALKKAIEE